jgi:hypothetical protein
MKGFLVLVVSFVTLSQTTWATDKPADKNVTIVAGNNSPRLKYGTEKLTAALQKAGYKGR